MVELVTKYLNESSKPDYEIAFNSFCNDQKLMVETYHNATILPLKFSNNGKDCSGGIVDENHEYITSSAWFGGGGDIMATSYEVRDVMISSEKVIYCGVYIDHWGHFLLESTTRLWYYLLLPPEEQQKYKLAFLCRTIEPDKQEKEFFELLGVYDKCIWVTKPMQFETVIIPESSSIFGQSYTKEFICPFVRIAEMIAPSFHQKVYFTRSAYKQNANTIGEEKLEDVFRENGYEILSPENLTLREQIAIFKGAKSLVMLNGSACHTSLFVQNASNLVILNRFSLKNQAQFIINSVSNLSPIYVDAYFSFLPVAHGLGPFWVGITKHLISFCKDNNLKIPETNLHDDVKEMYEFLQKWEELYSRPRAMEWINHPFYIQKMPTDIEDFLINKNIIQRPILFDEEWYKKTYNIKENAREHYYQKGYILGYNPSPDFNTNAYLNAYPDVKAAKMNPLDHYIRYGKKEGRKIFPVKRE